MKNKINTDKLIISDSERIKKSAEYYLDCAVKHTEEGNRNNTGFWLACQLRDLGLDKARAKKYILKYQQATPEGFEPYTAKEADKCLRFAYNRISRGSEIVGVSKIKHTTSSGISYTTYKLDPKIFETLLKFSFTEAGNAELFKALKGNKFYFVKEKSKWFQWDGVRWQENNEQVRLEMLEIVKLRKKAVTLIEDEKTRKIYQNKIEGLDSIYKIKAALTFAEAMLIKNYTEFDQNPYLLACSNGIIDLKSGILRPAKPEDMLHKSCEIRFDPNAPCEKWLKFLNDIFLGNESLINFVQKAIGYSITGSTSEQCIFICYNKGSNGKSTFLTVIEYLLGEYAISTPSSTFRERYRDDAIPNDVARMCGMRFVKSVEINEHIRLNEERIKTLTGGDRITARFLHKEFFDFYPTAKIWWAVNHKPIIQGTDEAIWRRIHLIPFNAHFSNKERNKRPQEEILAELKNELPGILAWAVEGCLKLQKEGLRPVEEIRKATSVYRAESDIVGKFLNDCTDQTDENAKVKAGDLYDAFKNWCNNNNEKIMSNKVFGEKLSEKGFTEDSGKKVRRLSGWHYLGITLIDEVKDETPNKL